MEMNHHVVVAIPCFEMRFYVKSSEGVYGKGWMDSNGHEWCLIGDITTMAAIITTPEESRVDSDTDILLCY